MNKNTLQLVGLLTLIAALFGIAIALQRVRDASFPPRASEDDSALYLTSGLTVRRLSVAYRALAADLYWIRAIQYYGGTKRAIAGGQGEGGASGPNVAAPSH